MQPTGSISSASLGVVIDAERPLLRSLRVRILPGAFAIAFGMAMTLCIQGYQFGQSNHTVYLFDAMRHVRPELLKNDWFATRTLQYHAIFGWMTAVLLKAGVLEQAFLAGYLGLTALLHLAWYRLVLRLGGTRFTYLLSVLFYYISAGGTALGMYSFFQDSSFLPSNIANVAMLWGIYFWIAGKRGWSGAWLGLAGAFHLNHALVGIGMWIALNLWLWKDRVFAWDRATIVGSALAIGLSLLNILLALRVAAEQTGGMPLGEFVDLYVRLRHGHHYDPSAWPLALWICFLWSAPLAAIAARRQIACPPVRQTVRVYLLLAALLVVALLGAGIFYVSESLIQMSLYRFTIYLKLFNSIGAAYLIYNAGVLKRSHVRAIVIGIPAIMVAAIIVLFCTDGFGFSSIRWLGGFVWRQRGPIGLAVILSITLAIYELVYALPRKWGQNLLHGGGIAVLVIITAIAWGRWLGVDAISDDDEAYLQFCAWVRQHTPVDAVFLVPPQEQSFRIAAQRAIVINYKGVPQLSGELPEWRRRLEDVLDMKDLRALPRPFEVTLPAIAQRYRALSAEHLASAAQRYGARYIVATRPLEKLTAGTPMSVAHENGEYFLYDLKR